MSDLPPMRAKGMVHKRIADLAKRFAREQWEELAGQNAFYRSWPKPQPFIKEFWPNYVPVARATLTKLLGSPTLSQRDKDEIHECLLLDGAVNPKDMAKPAEPTFTFSK